MGLSYLNYSREQPAQIAFCSLRRSSSVHETAVWSAVGAEGSARGCSAFGCMSRVSKIMESGDKHASCRQIRAWAMDKLAMQSIESIGATEDQIHDSIVSVTSEKPKSIPKWKAIVAKLRCKLNENLHKLSANTPNSAPNSREGGPYRKVNMKGCKKQMKLSRSVIEGSGKQNPHVFPALLAKHVHDHRQQSSTPLIWERRNVAQPPTLDLRNLKVTGMHQLMRRR